MRKQQYERPRFDAKGKAVDRDSARMLLTLMSNLPGMAYRCNNDTEWTMHFVSQGCLGLTGYTAEELLENRCVSYAEVIHPEDRDMVWRGVQEAVDAGRPFVLEYRIVTADGEVRWVWEKGVAIRSQDGDLLALEGFITDINDRKAVEEALRQSEEKARAMYELLPIATFVWQARGDDLELVDFNVAAREMTKGGAASWLGSRASQAYADSPEIIEDLKRCLKKQNSYRKEMDYRYATSGLLRTLVVTFGFVPPDMVMVHTEDVTEQRETEQQLRQAQKMEAIGQLAGGIAHDFNNLLTVMNSYADFAVNNLHQDDPLWADINEIREAGERASRLTHKLLAFSRRQVLKPQVLDLHKVISGMRDMLKRLIGEDIRLSTVPAEDLDCVEADPVQIEQVIMNLASNARDAMPRGGELVIETKNVFLDEEYAARHVSVKPGPYVLLAVSDTGEGMSEETRSRLFEPFFSTKAHGKGTGLGLATVYGIVKQSGGNIWVYSEPGNGSTFKIYLPRVKKTDIQQPKRATTEAAPRGTETVLVVEDDDVVRNLVFRILKVAGYDVLTAANGGEALMMCEQLDKPLQLLLTDVVMPGMSGRELFERLDKLFDDVQVLYMSGYTDDAMMHHGVLERDTNFISKPFDVLELTKKVREVLDG